jgi:hypothetical protein
MTETLAAAAAALLFLIIAFATKRRFLPVLAMWAFVLLPVGYTALPSVVGRHLTPALLLILIWELRVITRRGRERGAHGIFDAGVVVLLGALVLSSFLGESALSSLLWVTVFAVTTVLAARAAIISDVTDLDIGALQRHLLYIGAFIGVVALVELLFQFNPWELIYTELYRDRSWSVARAKASFGHPLVLSLVASAIVASGVAFTVRRPLLLALGMGGAVLGLILSVSRTGLVATALGVMIAVVSQSIAGARGARWRAIVALLLGSGVVILAWNSDLLQDRQSSADGTGSSTYRDAIFERAVRLIESGGFTGYGPGRSIDVYTQNYPGLILENSALQLVISLGAISILVLLAIILSGIASLRRSRAWAPAGLAAVCVSLSGFNALDGNPAILVVAVPFIVACWAPREDAQQISEQKPRKQVARIRPPAAASRVSR